MRIILEIDCGMGDLAKEREPQIIAEIEEFLKGDTRTFYFDEEVNPKDWGLEDVADKVFSLTHNIP